MYKVRSSGVKFGFHFFYCWDSSKRLVSSHSVSGFRAKQAESIHLSRLCVMLNALFVFA
jgi:hypothetical protein